MCSEMFSFDNDITVVIVVITQIMRHFFSIFFKLIKNDINFIKILTLLITDMRTLFSINCEIMTFINTFIMICRKHIWIKNYAKCALWLFQLLYTSIAYLYFKAAHNHNYNAKCLKSGENHKFV